MRIGNVEWLVSNAPKRGHWIFQGGPIASYLVEGAGYCFVYCQFLAAIVLGLAFIEHTLATIFFASGQDDLERAGASTILREKRAELDGYLMTSIRV